MEDIAWKDVFELRAQLYAFLGNSLLAPMREDMRAGLDQSFWEQFPLEPANEHMDNALEALAACCGRLADCSEGERVRSANVEYTRLFMGPGAPPAPPWESLYREGGKFLFGQPTFDMRAVLREHGLALKEDAHQLEDHIGAELLFLAAMSERFVGKAPSADEVTDQVAFIDGHPLWWIGKLHAKAVAAADLGYYPALIELVWGVLEWDKELLSEYLAQG